MQLGRAGVWTALAAGPLALVVAVGQPSATEAATPVPKPRATQTASVADPAGYVALFVDAWLRSSDDARSAAARRVQAMAPGILLPSPDTKAPVPRRVTAVRSTPGQDGRWSVTVAAQYADAVRYFAVPAIASAGGSSFAVTAAPALVAAPTLHKIPDSPYDVTVPEGPLATTAEQFLAAYLAGRGEVNRYLAPGAQLTAISPAAADSVEVQEVTAREQQAVAEQVPGDGTTVHVLAQVEARDAAGRWPLAYELTVSARDGRWEIAALASGSSGGAAR
ncbi:conjugal transfer protein [Streptomyces sp. NPDC051214]|uniref:conjugal transfer protein n=1 Tax=Streptomyces sp. NPDC051214 TaxID=3155282 RepID=UPI0034390992